MFDINQLSKDLTITFEEIDDLSNKIREDVALLNKLKAKRHRLQFRKRIVELMEDNIRAAG